MREQKQRYLPDFNPKVFLSLELMTSKDIVVEDHKDLVYDGLNLIKPDRFAKVSFGSTKVQKEEDNFWDDAGGWSQITLSDFEFDPLPYSS